VLRAPKGPQRLPEPEPLPVPQALPQVGTTTLL
jgi:hypothetical protein